MRCVALSVLLLSWSVSGASGAELIFVDPSSSGSPCKMVRAGNAIKSNCDLKVNDVSLLSSHLEAEDTTSKLSLRMDDMEKHIKTLEQEIERVKADVHAIKNPPTPAPTLPAPCTCNNGEAAQGEQCAKPGSVTCARCVKGFHLTGGACQPNVCQCSNGQPVIGADCTSHGANHCKACNSFYHKSGKDCHANQCKCSGGWVGGGPCRSHGGQQCGGCHRRACIVYRNNRCVYVHGDCGGR